MSNDARLANSYSRLCDEWESTQMKVDDYDNYWGWMLWIRKDIEAFAYFCYEHFFSALREDFQCLLHPESRPMTDDPSEALGDNWPLWCLFLMGVLDTNRLKILAKAYVNSNKEAFEAWVGIQ